MLLPYVRTVCSREKNDPNASKLPENFSKEIGIANAFCSLFRKCRVSHFILLASCTEIKSKESELGTTSRYSKWKRKKKTFFACQTFAVFLHGRQCEWDQELLVLPLLAIYVGTPWTKRRKGEKILETQSNFCTSYGFKLKHFLLPPWFRFDHALRDVRSRRKMANISSQMHAWHDRSSVHQPWSPHSS